MNFFWVILSIFLFWSAVYGSELEFDKELDEIYPVRENSLNGVYSKILCIGCGGKKFINHDNDCPVAQDLRSRVNSLVEKGFNKDEIIWNFNASNIAFIYQLPAEVIRNLNCPCACAEKVWVCLASENRYSCPVIEIVTKDIEKLKQQDKSDGEVVKLLRSSQYQNKYNLIVETAINESNYIEDYDTYDIPDFVLDNAKCTCECTESLRTCIEKMPWCKRATYLINKAKLYLNIIGLSPQDTVKSIYAPCAKLCGKRIGGRYLGKNCYVCQRPVIDEAYYTKVNGKMEVFCCKSCSQLDKPVPEYILENVLCKICPCEELLSECNSTHFCPLPEIQKQLIKTWLLQGMTEDEIIVKFRRLQ